VTSNVIAVENQRAIALGTRAGSCCLSRACDTHMISAQTEGPRSESRSRTMSPSGDLNAGHWTSQSDVRDPVSACVLEMISRAAETQSVFSRISDLAVVPYLPEHALCPDFAGSDVRNPATEGDTLWVKRNTSPFQFMFTGFLKVAFQGSRVTSDVGLILVRELDEHLGLEEIIAEHLSDSRQV
jgi:hypothetical protein